MGHIVTEPVGILHDVLRKVLTSFLYTGNTLLQLRCKRSWIGRGCTVTKYQVVAYWVCKLGKKDLNLIFPSFLYYWDIVLFAYLHSKMLNPAERGLLFELFWDLNQGAERAC